MRLTREQKKEKAVEDLINQMFIAWGKKYLQTNLRERAKSAERQMQWFSLQYGLKFSDFPHAEE
jgi:hypothetical protein